MGFDNVNVNVSGPKQPTSIYKTKVLKGNHSFASQVTEPNTKYVIKYDFTLGEDITVPENCILEFDGGSISNGKCISNHTEIIGNIKGDALYGIYYKNGNPLTYNYKVKKELNFSIEYGYSNQSGDLSGRMVGESLVVTQDNIFVFAEKDSTNVEVDVFDKNFNLIKECPLSLGSHANDATLFGDFILLAQNENANDIVKIKISEILAANDGDTVICDYLGVTLTGKSYYIDYDNKNEELAIYADHKINIYDKNLNLIKVCNISKEDLETKFGTTFTGAGFLFKNGQCVFNFWDYQLGSVYYGGVVYVGLDVNTEESYIIDTNTFPFYSSEPEGICIDTENDNVFWGCIYVKNDDSRFITICKFSFSETIIGNSTRKNNSTAAIDNQSVIYVDNTYTGKSTGESSAPYKRLDTALIMCFNGNPFNPIIRIKNSSIYFAPTISVYGKSLYIRGGAENVVPTVVSKFFVSEGHLDFYRVKLKNNDNSGDGVVSARWNSFINIASCEVLNDDNQSITTAVYSDTSFLRINNVTFRGFTNAINLNRSTIKEFISVTLDNCTYLLLVTNSCSIDSYNPLSQITYRTAKFINPSGGVVKPCILIHQVTSKTELDEIITILQNFVAGSTTVFKVMINITSIFDYEDTLNNLKYRIRRGMYFYNGGTQIVSIDGKGGIYDSNIVSGYNIPPFDVDNLKYSGNVGTLYFEDNIGKPIVKGTSKYMEMDGASVGVSRVAGTSARPVSDDIYKGFLFYDTSLKKPIWARSVTGSPEWKESDSAAAGVKRSGTKARRPNGSDIYVGFQYMQIDSTNGTFPIWASAISGSTVIWVKADGSDPDA